MPETPEQAIILDVWTVAEDDRDEFISTIVEMFERLRGLDGFIEGQLLMGANPSLFATYARMRSAPERDAALIDPGLQAMMRRVRGIVDPNPHSYTVAQTFKPAAHKRPAP